MLGGVEKANYFIALMQRAMMQAIYIMLTRVISLLLTLVLQTGVITMISHS